MNLTDTPESCCEICGSAATVTVKSHPLCAECAQVKQYADAEELEVVRAEERAYRRMVERSWR